MRLCKLNAHQTVQLMCHRGRDNIFVGELLERLGKVVVLFWLLDFKISQAPYPHQIRPDNKSLSMGATYSALNLATYSGSSL